MAILINKRIQFTLSDTICDLNGRYIIVTGSLFQVPVVLVNVYAPNWDDVQFANNLLSLIPKLNTHHLIFAGDLNCVMDPRLDRSSTNNNAAEMAKIFFSFMQQNGCVDPWRFLNPSTRQFSFYSHVHHSFFRLDYFFIDSLFVSKIEKVDYSAIVVSDHALVLILPSG